ncbi:MAG TPA: PLP-dependent aminotransferase family protein [Anaerolineae bacterium]|nr:PLP-dependent aminotransferase family protein [Anaerolineae bacterium]
MKTLLIPLDPSTARPLYLQVADYITNLARHGNLKAGSQLPPTRVLAEQLLVHRSTVINAYEELKARGVIEARQGSGSFIATGLDERTTAIRPAPPSLPTQPDELIAELRRLNWAEGVISLGYGPPADELMPVEDFDRARRRVLRRDGPKTANYELPQGYHPLRQAIAVHLAGHGVQVDPEDVIITAGALEGVSLVARALAAPGDSLLIELPEYFGYWTNLVYQGLNLTGFELLESGPDWNSFGHLLEEIPVRPRFVFVTPDHQNPMGIRWGMPQRYQFLKTINEHDLPIVEDGTYRDLTYDGPPHPPLRALDTEVIYVGTFSHSLMPGLRLGFVVCGGRLRDHVVRLKAASSGPCETLNQRALADFITSGEYGRHLERIIPVYRSRRDSLLEALQGYFPPEVRWSCPAGGFFIWIWLPGKLSPQVLFSRALKSGISIAPAAAFYPGQAAQNAFRLAFSRYPEEVLARAAMTLGRLLEAMLKDYSRGEQNGQSAKRTIG